MLPLVSHMCSPLASTCFSQKLTGGRTHPAPILTATLGTNPNSRTCFLKLLEPQKGAGWQHWVTAFPLHSGQDLLMKTAVGLIWQHPAHICFSLSLRHHLLPFPPTGATQQSSRTLHVVAVCLSEAAPQMLSL